MQFVSRRQWKHFFYLFIRSCSSQSFSFCFFSGVWRPRKTVEKDRNEKKRFIFVYRQICFFHKSTWQPAEWMERTSELKPTFIFSMAKIDCGLFNVSHEIHMPITCVWRVQINISWPIKFRGALSLHLPLRHRFPNPPVRSNLIHLHISLPHANAFCHS